MLLESQQRDRREQAPAVHSPAQVVYDEELLAADVEPDAERRAHAAGDYGKLLQCRLELLGSQRQSGLVVFGVQSDHSPAERLRIGWQRRRRR